MTSLETETSNIALTVHRSASEVGGNCLEIAVDKTRLILDVGRPLAVTKETDESLPESLDLSLSVEGVLISHPHQDHYGHLQHLPSDWPVFSGEDTAKLIRLSPGKNGVPQDHHFTPWKAGRPFKLGPFTITPLLTDHSAFDAYMLLVDVAGKRLLYTGDFRKHGRKAALVEQTMRSPPSNVDALIMESTNLGRETTCKSEAELEVDFTEIFERTKGRVFISWSGQNVDRTVTIYRACKKAGRTLVLDLYTAEILQAMSAHASLPRPGWPYLKVVITKGLSKRYHLQAKADLIKRMVPFGMSSRKLALTPEKWVVMVRPSLLVDYIAAGARPTAQDAWCWSMWKGYLKNEQTQGMKRTFEDTGMPLSHVHTSGHASRADLQEFAKRINPKVLISVHGEVSKSNCEGFPSLTHLTNGIPFVL